VRAQIAGEFRSVADVGTITPYTKKLQISEISGCGRGRRVWRRDNENDLNRSVGKIVRQTYVKFTVSRDLGRKVKRFDHLTRPQCTRMIADGAGPDRGMVLDRKPSAPCGSGEKPAPDIAE
jgi:hypothetical protein